MLSDSPQVRAKKYCKRWGFRAFEGQRAALTLDVSNVTTLRFDNTYINNDAFDLSR